MARIEDMRDATERPPIAAMLTYLMLGPILWSLHLTLVYGTHTLICALGTPAAASATVIAATVAVAAAIVLVILSQRRVGRLFGLGEGSGQHRTYDSIARILGVLSLAGVIWVGAAAAVLDSCVLGR